MAKGKELNMKIPSVGDLFSTQEEREEVGRESVRNIPLEDVPAIVQPKKMILMKWLLDTEDEWQVS